MPMNRHRKKAEHSVKSRRPRSDTSCNRKYSPAVARYWLLLVAGLLWSGVGITLCIVASSWLSHADWPESGGNAASGFGSGFWPIVWVLGYRQEEYQAVSLKSPNRLCLFAFQAWPSYVLIIFMASLGFALRQSHLSRHILAGIYLIVGTGLALGSSLYYREFM